MQDFLITVSYDGNKVVEFYAEAESAEALRDQYVKIFNKRTLGENATVEAFQKIDDNWVIIPDLF